MGQSIDWKNLGFQYRRTSCFVTVSYHDGAWGAVETHTDPCLPMHIGATALHYGQACFEGLKAFRRKDGSVALFRPEENGKRMIDSARRLVMTAPPVELFMEAVTTVIKKNIDYVPPYGTGASLYVRPLLIGTTPRVGLRPAEDFLFIVLVTPVGPYYKDGFFPVKAMVQRDYDRAAPQGVGHIKAAGNYAAGAYGDLEGKKKGFPICLYLDAASHTTIDEFGTSNFFALTDDGSYLTPASRSILPSITNRSLQTIARDFGLSVEQRRIELHECASFSEVGACGTAAIITPVYSITDGDTTWTFGESDKAGPTLTRFYEEIVGIQYGEKEDRHNWMVPVA